VGDTTAAAGGLNSLAIFTRQTGPSWRTDRAPPPRGVSKNRPKKILVCDFQRYLAGPVAVVWLVIDGWKRHLGIVGGLLRHHFRPVNGTNHPATVR